MVEILNLDKMIPDSKEIILGGKTYKVAGTLTVGVALELFKKFGKFQENPEDLKAVEAVLESTINIFEMENPGMDKKEFQFKLPIALVGELVKFLVKSATELEGEKEGKKEEMEPVKVEL